VKEKSHVRYRGNNPYVGHESAGESLQFPLGRKPGGTQCAGKAERGLTDIPVEEGGSQTPLNGLIKNISCKAGLSGIAAAQKENRPPVSRRRWTGSDQAGSSTIVLMDRIRFVYPAIVHEERVSSPGELHE